MRVQQRMVVCSVKSAILQEAWHWGSPMTTRSQVTTTAYPGSSRVHREDLTVQVELSTVVASDYAEGQRNSCMQPDAKVRDVKVARQTVSFGPIDGEAEEDEEAG